MAGVRGVTGRGRSRRTRTGNRHRLRHGARGPARSLPDRTSQSPRGPLEVSFASISRDVGTMLQAAGPGDRRRGGGRRGDPGPAAADACSRQGQPERDHARPGLDPPGGRCPCGTPRDARWSVPSVQRPRESTTRSPSASRGSVREGCEGPGRSVSVRRGWSSVLSASPGARELPDDRAAADAHTRPDPGGRSRLVVSESHRRVLQGLHRMAPPARGGVCRASPVGRGRAGDGPGRSGPGSRPQTPSVSATAIDGRRRWPSSVACHLPRGRQRRCCRALHGAGPAARRESGPRRGSGFCGARTGEAPA